MQCSRTGNAAHDRMSIKRPLLLSALPKLLLNPIGEKHSLVKTRSQGLMAWKITGNLGNRKNFKQCSQTHLHVPESQVKSQVASRLGTIGLAGVSENKLIQLNVPLSKILNYLSTLFDKDLQYRTKNSQFTSAISAYLCSADGNPFGKYPRDCALLTGIFNQRPPQFLWDVEIAFVYLKTNMNDNSQLSDKDCFDCVFISILDLINTTPKYQVYGKECHVL